MVVVFVVGGTGCPLNDDEARELAQRLLETTDDIAHPARVIATKIDLLLIKDTTAEPPELRLLDSETNILASTIGHWLEDVGAAALPDGIMRLRYALDADARVDIGYLNGIYRLPRHRATVLAETLRIKAATKEGTDAAAARQVADAIEDVLVGTADEPVRLTEETAEPVFAVLNASLADSEEPLVAEEYSLYLAIRDNRPGQA